MPVSPTEAERITSNLFDIGELEIAARHKTNGPLMALAGRARAKSPQHLVLINALVSVGPYDFHRARTAWGVNFNGGWL